MWFVFWKVRNLSETTGLSSFRVTEVNRNLNRSVVSDSLRSNGL